MIPTFRRPDLLKQAVESALAQTTSVSYEVVIVDNDNDNDGYLLREVDKVVASFSAPNLRHFRNQTNIGLYGNWNRCIELARGRWLTILNDDDLLDPSFLEESLKVITCNPSIKWVGCSARVCDIQGITIPETLVTKCKKFFKGLANFVRRGRPHKIRFAELFPSYPHHGSLGILFDRNAAMVVGGYPLEFYPVADYVFGARFALLSDLRYLPKVLATYRIAVNVSTKPDVCVLGLQLELKLRESMVPLIPFNAFILRYYSKLIAIRTASVFKSRWYSALNVDDILAKEGLTNRPVLAIYLTVGALVRFGILHIFSGLPACRTSKSMIADIKDSYQRPDRNF